ncbi:MAG: beta-ketoacyl-[acyl-carrier-protein] synthase family protein [Nitrospirae bacterium]|nr:beta-ketoacyl-[acyl-carrier-protein] synthase family protein [Nitrospirota bacterium]
MKHNVVVTGLGLVTPLKPFKGVDVFWKALCSGEDAVKRMPPPMLDLGKEWLTARIDIPGKFGNINPEDKILFIAEEAMRMAMEDAGLKGENPPTSPFAKGGLLKFPPLLKGGRGGFFKIGLSLGTVLGNVLFKERRLMREFSPLSRGDEGVCPPLWKRGVRGDFQKKNINKKESLSYITSYLASKFNLNGFCITVSTACASGTDAIGIASRKIAAGKADIMIAGGADVLSDFAITGFHVLQALTGEIVRPFDKNRSGLALGEGAAFIVLESEEHAAGRGAKIYGRILGYASRSDAHHLTGPHREGRGLADAMDQALSGAKIDPHEVNYINAHGTGTLYNDLMETKAIKKVFGKTAYDIPVNSTKSMLGHSFGAAGAIETICCLLSIKNKRIHPTINYSEKDPECDLDYVPNASRRHEVNIAMSLSSGFGGQNSVIIAGGV